MIWALIGLLALAALGIALFALKLPRASSALFASALLFGLAGYVLQGSPSQQAAPKSGQNNAQSDGEALVAARRAVFDDGRQPQRFIVIADGFARRGQYEDAAQILQGAIAEQPDGAEAWTALANALVEHAGGQLTPAALHAYGRAEEVARGHPGPGYFLGIALLRSGRPQDAIDLWSRMLEAAPQDAPWRAELAARLRQLKELTAQMQASGDIDGGQGR